jgi:RNA polymerase sigma-70 factor (ECF subfamily)
MGDSDSEQLTELLLRWTGGDREALARILPIMYNELHRLAHRHLAAERADHTLQTTALLNEAFIRLMGGTKPQLWSRSHFIGVASRVMRQILVDYARQRLAQRRSGGQRIELEVVSDLMIGDDAQIVALDDALDALTQVDERQARIVDMKFFGGLTAAEIADVLEVSLATVERDWAVARLWLKRQMNGAMES